MNIEINPETERLVREAIGSGHFQSVDEVIVTGINAWKEKNPFAAGADESREAADRRKAGESIRELRKGITLDRPEGLTKLLIDPKTERVLGVGICGPGAGDLIAEGVLAIEMCALAADVGMTIHPHPTLSETMMEAAEIFYGQATDIYRPRK